MVEETPELQVYDVLVGVVLTVAAPVAKPQVVVKVCTEEIVGVLPLPIVITVDVLQPPVPAVTV